MGEFGDFKILDSLFGGFLVFLTMMAIIVLMFKTRVFQFTGGNSNSGFGLNPKSCAAYQEEHDRSMKNEGRIAVLELSLKEIRQDVKDGFAQQVTNQQLVLSNLQLIVQSLGKRPKDWSDSGGGGYEKS